MATKTDLRQRIGEMSSIEELRDEAKHLAYAKEQEWIDLAIQGSTLCTYVALGESQAWMRLASALGWNNLKSQIGHNGDSG